MDEPTDLSGLNPGVGLGVKSKASGRQIRCTEKSIFDTVDELQFVQLYPPREGRLGEAMQRARRVENW